MMAAPLQIGLICQSGQAWQGGVEYIRNLAITLESLPEASEGAFEIHVIHPRGTAETEPIFGGDRTRHVFFEGHKSARRSLAHRAADRVRRSLGKDEPSRLEHFLNDLDLDFLYPFQSDHPERLQFRHGSWIPDFQHRFLPDMFSTEEAGDRDRAFESAANRAPLLVVSSETARAHLEEFYPRAAKKVRTLRFATSPQAKWYGPDAKAICDGYSLPERFFMLPNQFWKHKNHTLVFQALETLARDGEKPIVVCTGPVHDYRHPMFMSEVLQEISRRGLVGQVILLGLVPKADQVQIMRRSLGFLQPSRFEGWSTVVEEARCLGKRILLSDLPVHREQDPPFGEFFAPDDADGLAKAISAAWKQWRPGPDATEESEARDAAIRAAEDYARAFLSIARDAP